MPELWGILCALSITVAVVTVVGHALWLVFAAIFRALFHTSTPIGDRHADIVATRRQLRRWAEEAKVTNETHGELLRLLESELGSPHPIPEVKESPFSTPAAVITGTQPVGEPTAFTPARRPAAPRIPQRDPSEKIVSAEVVEEVHPLDRVPETVAPPPPAEPRRTFADVLQSFMEQRNIRWIEVISGLLVVGGATGLVFSLRVALKDKIPYFPALTFMLVTAAFHAAGIYSLRRWNLKSTSRGVLIIATLLVPLSILAGIFLSGEGEQQYAVTEPVYLLAVAIGVLSFGTMNYFASRALIRHGWWRMMLAVLGASFGQLIVNRSPANPGPIGAVLQLLPAVGSYVAVDMAMLFWMRSRKLIGRRVVQQFFLELGIATFAVLAPIGLFIARSESASAALRNLSPLLSLVAATVLATGLFAHRRFQDRRLASFKLTGTAIAIFGAGLMLLMVVFAWPDLRLLVAVGVLNFGTLSVLAAIGDLALLHGLAVGCLALAYMAGFLWWRHVPGTEFVGIREGLNSHEFSHSGVGRLLLHEILKAVSASALTAFSSVVALMGLGLFRRHRDVGLAYLLASAVIGLFSVAIAFYAGYWVDAVDGNWATWLFLYFAVAALVGGWFINEFKVALLGSALLLAGTVHGTWLNDWLIDRFVAAGLVLDRPILVGTLAHSVIIAVVAGLASWLLHRSISVSQIADPQESSSTPAPDHATADPVRAHPKNRAWIAPLSWSALATSILATPFALGVVDQKFGIHAVYLVTASMAWLSVALLREARWAWSGFQLLATTAVTYCSAYIAVKKDWWTVGLWDARHIHLQIGMLALCCIGWSGLRRWLQRDVAPFLRVPSTMLTMEDGLLALLVVAANVAAASGCIPGIWKELGLSLDYAGAALNNALSFFSGSAWLAWGAIVAALGFSLWQRRSLSVLLTLIVASAVVPMLLAGRFFDQNATASALRWMFALYAVAWGVPACYFGGTQNRATRWTSDVPLLMRPSDVMRMVSLVVALLTVVGMTTAVLVRVASGDGMSGPIADSIFARIGNASSYAGPLAMLVGVLFAYAVREAQAAYAFAGSLVFQYFISLACLLPALSAGAPLDAATWAKVVQWNVVGLATFTGVWAASRAWIEPQRVNHPLRLNEPSYLSAQVMLLLLGMLVLTVWISGSIWFDRSGILPTVQQLGTWPSYLSLVLAAGSIAWLSRREANGVRSDVFQYLLLVTVAVIAATVHGLSAAGQGSGYHTLVLGWMIAAGIAAGWMWWRMRAVALTWSPVYASPVASGVTWATVAMSLSVFSAATIFVGVSSRICEAVAACLGIFVAGVVAVRSRRQLFVYASIAFAGIAVVLFHFELPAGHSLRTARGLLPQFNFVVLAAACAWLACEVWFQRRGEWGLRSNGAGAAHRFIARVSLVAALCFIGGLSLKILFASHYTTLTSLELAACILMFVALFALQFGSLWDRKGHYATFGLYVWLAVVSVFVVDLLPLDESARAVAWIGTMATQVAVTGWVWSWGGKLAAIGGRLGMVDPIDNLRRTSHWLIYANLILSTAVILTSTWVVLSADARELRVAAACLPLLVAGGIAGIAQQHRRDAMQLATLLIIAWAAVLLGWSDIAPDNSTAIFLARAIRLLMALAVMTFVLGVIGVRVIPSVSPWRNSARRGAVVLAASAIAALCSVLALEAVTFQPKIGAPVTPVQIAAVTVVLVGLIAALISLAVLPGRDPLSLSERGRMAYVYGAQAVAALLFAHIYLAIPSLFHGTLRPYWPYIIVVIAFAGVGVGTLFERLGWRVLAEPFQRSGAFLPLVPALGMWVIGHESNSSIVLFVIGVLYMLISFSQKSMWAGAAAAVAGNSSLWSLLRGDENLTFGQHPQFWLIPPAVSLIIAAQLNRARLNDTQLAGIRYAAMLVIYLSSAAEIFTIGIGESLWPPMILICLSLAGIAFGIAMQVRAYLFLGSAFLLMSVVSMVAHASRSIHHVWPWWAFLIAMGVLILVVFGYFEGRRTQILAMIERLRQWEK